MTTPSGFGVDTTYKFYDILEVAPTCTEEELKKAYRKLALKVHPDKQRSQPGDQKDFSEINDAYKFLSDPLRRKFYDRQGDKGYELLSKSGFSDDGAFSTKSFFGRLSLRILTNPTILIPVSWFFGLVFVALIAFIWMFDWKRDGWNVSWLVIFIPMWFTLGVVLLLSLVITVVVFWTSLTVSKASADSNSQTNERDSKELVRRIRSLALSMLVVDSWITGAFATSIYLAHNLETGLPFEPAFIHLFRAALVSQLMNILSVINSWPYQNTVQLKRLKLLSLFLGMTYQILFTYFLTQSWDKKLAGIILSSVLLLIALHHYIKRLIVDCKLKVQLDEMNRSQPRLNSISAKQQAESAAKMDKSMHLSVAIGLSLQLILFSTHYLFNWPKTVTWTFFSLVITSFVNVIVFFLLLPLIFWGMNYAMPHAKNRNKNTTTKPQTGDSSDTIVIDLPRFGYGLAPIQPRLTYK